MDEREGCGYQTEALDKTEISGRREKEMKKILMDLVSNSRNPRCPNHSVDLRMYGGFNSLSG
jgi:hypothetical protein